ncbi:MAG: type II 3-dehydroquinate dehydratase [Saprospiraceae bacterium]|nr:type II 3-dehydroquinate dehydratase [Saprospiraceae bacterium]
MHLVIINGPNLNLLGRREPEVYGSTSFDDFFMILQQRYPSLKLSYFQSNHEGALIDHLHEVGFIADGIILNAGAYTHTSIALADAVSAIPAPVVEVHISNVHAREKFRHHSYLSAVCKGSIVGLGLEGYRLAVEWFFGRLVG